MRPQRRLIEYSIKLSWWSRKLEQLRFLLIRALTRNGSGLFLKAHDAISPRPMISTAHEPALEGFIRKAAQSGYGDFFIDIGANIGLTSCFVGAHFKYVLMYEPNPLSANIAEVNAAISLPAGSYNVRRVALGGEGGKLTLKCPKHNWGGAHIQKGNQYNSATLARKDALSEDDPASYIFLEVQMAEAKEELSRVFAEIPGLNFGSAGVIKIDAEGYEFKILELLAKALPRNKSYIIVFECLEPLADPGLVIDGFPFKTVLTKLSRLDGWKDPAHSLHRIFDRSTRYRLTAEKTNLSGDLILFLEPQEGHAS